MGADYFTTQSLSDRLSEEIWLGEKFRLFILAVVMGVILAGTTVNYCVYQVGLEAIFKGNTFIWALILFGMLFIRSSNLQLIITRRMKKGKKIHPVFRYTNTAFEVSIPSLIIVIFAQKITPVFALITPVVFIYFIFIVLSTLELDFYLSLFTGTMAALQYLFLSLYYQSQSELIETIPLLNLHAPFIGKAAILLLTGIIAGLVAREIRKRMMQSFKVLEDRNRIERLFGQQVSSQIVDELIREKQEIIGRQRFVCIMFLDIKDFTPFSEGKKPEEIIKYQNDVFAIMIEIINKHHGLINQFMGDGFMATFGAPISSPQDCQYATEAALEIETTISKKSDRGEIPPTEIRIGLHAGDAVTGNVGTSIRKQYSITGNVVILASRLEQLNKKYQSKILISKEVYDKINQDNINGRSLGMVTVKGRKKPIHIYKLA